MIVARKPRHRVSDVDFSLMRGTCSVCGVVHIQIKKSGHFECKNKIKDSNARRYRQHPESKHGFWTCQKKYGITPDEVKTLFQEQAGQCAICSKDLDHGYQIDHCHISGRVRGILCKNCNLGLGLLQDHASHISEAALYLQTPPSANILAHST